MSYVPVTDAADAITPRLVEVVDDALNILRERKTLIKTEINTLYVYL